MSDLTQRPLVKKFLPHWQQIVKSKGLEFALSELSAGRYTMICRKDAMGIRKALIEGGMK